jgi:hypothetical protein
MVNYKIRDSIDITGTHRLEPRTGLSNLDKWIIIEFLCFLIIGLAITAIVI